MLGIDGTGTLREVNEGTGEFAAGNKKDQPKRIDLLPNEPVYTIGALWRLLATLLVDEIKSQRGKSHLNWYPYTIPYQRCFGNVTGKLKSGRNFSR